QYEGGGMWMDDVSTWAGGAGLRGGVPWPSPYFCTQKSSRSWTTGSTAKLYTGGGERIVHSRVRPSHRSAGGGAAPRAGPRGWGARLSAGGGEGCAHSRVRPSHGSAGAGAPERVVLTTLARKTR